MKRFVCGEVKSNVSIAENIYEMRVAERFIAENALPGQFVNIYTARADLLLPRPFGICETRAGDGEFRIIYQIVGGGTRHLSSFVPGAKINIVGPAGNGYPVLNAGSTAVIGGGTGVPPLLFLVKELRRQNGDAAIDVFLGFRGARQIILTDEFMKTGASVHISTDDGSEGFRGSAADCLRARKIKAGVIYSCGPRPMLKKIAEYAAGIDAACYISLEERMACGVGACLACAAKLNVSGGGFAYKKVCSDGPVFDAREYVFDE